MPVEVDYGNEQQGHYRVTPYTFTPKPGRKLIARALRRHGAGALAGGRAVARSGEHGEKSQAMSARRLRAVVFDFDGVIVESGDIKTEAFLELFAAYPQHLAAIKRHHLDHLGISRFKKFAWIYDNVLHEPYDTGEKIRLGDRFSAIVFQKVCETPFVPGAREALEALARAGVHLVVASGTPRDEARSHRGRARLATLLRGGARLPHREGDRGGGRAQALGVGSRRGALHRRRHYRPRGGYALWRALPRAPHARPGRALGVARLRVRRRSAGPRAACGELS